jgi:hypothetical protein
MSAFASKETFDHLMTLEGVRAETPEVKEGVLRDMFERFVMSPLNEIEFAKQDKIDRPDCWTPPKSDVNVESEVLYSADAQSRFVREHSVEELSEILARSGLKVGQIKKRTATETIDETSSSNPYAKSYRGKDREAAIIALINSNVKLATSLAKSAGCTITGQPLMPVGAARFQK